MPTTIEQFRDRDAARKRNRLRAGREVIIKPPEDLARRLALEADDQAWLAWYCAELFWYPFTGQQRQMIAAIRTAIIEGGDQALAASRGEGKSKIAERLLLKYTLAGAIKFGVLFAASGSAAADSLQSIMSEVETNHRLAADYPEVCAPVRSLENTPNRAHYQLVTGQRLDNGEPYRRVPSRFKWCGQELVFPFVPGAPAAGGIIATRGLDSAVRGLSKRDRRPDVAILDDPDTEDSANSPELAAKLERRIDRAIAGLGGQKRTVARVMLTTLQNRICASYRFTDPAAKSSWKGRRFRFLVTPPERADLWDEYVQLRRTDWREATDTAASFYRTHREAMDAGAEVANPNRCTPAQDSALQFYYDQVARTDAVAVATEYDNDPPEEVGPLESGINVGLVQRQVSGLDQGELPEGATALVHGIDVGKYRLHWVVRAFKPDGTGYTIDYGTHEVLGTTRGIEEGLDRAIKREILHRLAIFRDAYAQQFRESLTLVDCGYRTEAVYAACAEAGLGIMPIKGIGYSAGTAEKGHFRDVMRRTKDREPICDGVFLTRQRLDEFTKIKVVCADTDQWKAWEHDRWQTATDKPGCMFLYGERSARPDTLSHDQHAHGHYAHHICAEVEAEDIVKGAIVRKWISKEKENHWLDASYYADVAAAIKGIRVLSTALPPPEPSISARDLQAQARRRQNA